MLRCDSLLRTALFHLGENWFKESVGIVAATARLDSGEIVSETSRFQGAGRVVHAEAMILERLNVRGGRDIHKIDEFAITISPCRKISPSRVGTNCCALLNDWPIRKVHVGTIDAKQGQYSDYQDFEFGFSLTTDEDLARRCNLLLGIFSEFGSAVNTEMPLIKKQLGKRFWDKVFG